MSEKDLENMKALDDAAEKAGGFVDFGIDKNTHFDYRKITEYCKKKGIQPIDMTVRELNRFIIR